MTVPICGPTPTPVAPTATPSATSVTCQRFTPTPVCRGVCPQSVPQTEPRSETCNALTPTPTIAPTETLFCAICGQTPTSTLTATQTSIPTITPSPTPSCAPPICAINATDIIPNPASWSSEQGVYVAVLGRVVSGDGVCVGDGTDEDRLDCSDDVYDLYYSTYQNTVGSTPILQEILAAVFDEELGLAYNVGQGDAGIEAFANNYLASCRNGCTKAQIMWWLASKQGWYDYARNNPYKPIQNLVNSSHISISSPTAAGLVFTETWVGGYGDGTTPYDWANWRYNKVGYWEIRNDPQSVISVRPWSGWRDIYSYGIPTRQKDGLARYDNGLDQSGTQVPADLWTHYIFAIVSHNQDLALASSSGYSQCVDSRPSWLPASEIDRVNRPEGIGASIP